MPQAPKSARVKRKPTRKRLPPTEGAPKHHPGGGYYEAARAYGDAVTLVREWWPRRHELVAGCHAEGVSYRRIALLLGLSVDHTRKLHRQWKATVAAYEKREAEGGDVVVL